VPIEDNGNRGDVRNGILLCRNHHALMDSYAWTMDEELRVMIADDKAFRESAVANHILGIEGERIPNLPEDQDSWPDRIAVGIRLKLFEKYWT
jgi:predicted restriction endonuclease